MGVKDASLWLDNAHGPVERREGEELSFAVADDRHQAQSQVLRVHFRRKTIGQSFLLTRRNLDAISRCRQVTDNAAVFLGRPETSADEIDRHRRVLPIAERQQGLSWLAVDKLDAEDLGGGERSLDGNSQCRGLSRCLSFLGLVLDAIGVM